MRVTEAALDRSQADREGIPRHLEAIGRRLGVGSDRRSPPLGSLNRSILPIGRSFLSRLAPLVSAAQRPLLSDFRLFSIFASLAGAKSPHVSPYSMLHSDAFGLYYRTIPPASDRRSFKCDLSRLRWPTRGRSQILTYGSSPIRRYACGVIVANARYALLPIFLSFLFPPRTRERHLNTADRHRSRGTSREVSRSILPKLGRAETASATTHATSSASAPTSAD